MEAIAREFPLLKNWWTFVVRGILAIIAGILAFTRPGATLAALLFVFGIYAIVGGVFALAGAVQGMRNETRALYLFFEGLVGVAAGVIAFLAPGITAMVLLYVIAFWALVAGALELATASRLRKHVEGEWVLAFAGILSLLFGIFLIAVPGLGLLALIFQIGLYAVVFGIALVALGLRLRSWRSTISRSGWSAPELSGI